MEKLDTPIRNAPSRLLPFNGDQANVLNENGQLGADLTHTHDSVSQAYLKTMVPMCLFPALEHLRFMGIDRDSVSIQIEASWMPEGGYADQPGRPDDLREYREYTEDVSIAGFFALFFILCATIDASTTAHRRFKSKFSDQQIFIILDADKNRGHLFVTPELADAWDAGFEAWTRAK